MNLFRSEEHARRWSQFNPKSEDGQGFIALADLAAFFATESRHHMLDENYLSAWYPKRAAERMAVLQRIGKTTPFWLGTPDPA
jgi:hypothetical protein